MSEWNCRAWQVGGQAVLGRQNILPTPWLTERHGYDPTLAAESQRIVAARPLYHLQYRVQAKSSAMDEPHSAFGIVMDGYALGAGRASPIGSRVTVGGSVTPRLACLPP